MNTQRLHYNKIFLADDDADDRMFFEDALKQLAIPTQLILSKDGVELMRNLSQITEPSPLHIIFLDLNMPGKNGFECLQEIRNHPLLKEIPVVILSTAATDTSINKTYSNGANYYVCKPHSFVLLVKAIETILQLEMWQQPKPAKGKFLLV